LRLRGFASKKRKDTRNKKQEARDKKQETRSKRLLTVRFLCGSAPLRAKKEKIQEPRD
jgi:hypothetical protein